MPRPTLRTRLGNRKDTWCCCWPLTTCCSPPSRTAAVLPAQIWWSTVGGDGSTLGGAVCYFPQQPRLSRCPTAQAGSSGLSTVWRLQPGYLPGPLGDSADAGPAWWWTSFLSSWLRHAWWWWGGGGQSSEDNNMKSYGFVSHWANGFWSDLSLQAGVLLALSSSSPFGITHLFHLALTSSPSPISLQSDGTTAAGNFSHLSSLSSSSEWSMCM